MKIGFTGTMSVGKSTLVNALSSLKEFKGYEFITERSEYLYYSLNIPLNKESTILGQSVFLAERALELMKPKVIVDRTIIDVMAFTMTAKNIHVSEKVRFCDFACHLIKNYDYIFYIPPIVEIEDNGIRETNIEYRNEVDQKIKEILLIDSHRLKNFYEIKETTVEGRINFIKEIIFPYL